MTTPQLLWSDERIEDVFVKGMLGDHYIEAIPLAQAMRDEFEVERQRQGVKEIALKIELAAKDARIAELEAKLAASKPSVRRTDMGVRGGLIKGRIRSVFGLEPSTWRPGFHAALAMATTDDLKWALELMIKHPNAKRTLRNYRIKHIDKRLREIIAAAPGGEVAP